MAITEVIEVLQSMPVERLAQPGKWAEGGDRVCPLIYLAGGWWLFVSGNPSLEWVNQSLSRQASIVVKVVSANYRVGEEVARKIVEIYDYPLKYAPRETENANRCNGAYIEDSLRLSIVIDWLKNQEDVWNSA